MIYTSEVMEENALLDVAQLMCAAARTAPKTRGLDNIVTMVITGDEKLVLADKMEEIDERVNGENRTFFTRDAGNVRNCKAVVLIGIKKFVYGLNCGNCGFETCGACVKNEGTCVFGSVDLGVAVSSAVSTASSLHVDSRVMFSVGKAAAEMDYADGIKMWLGIPLSISGKSPFFDRK